MRSGKSTSKTGRPFKDPSMHPHRPLYIQITGKYAPAWKFGGPIRLMYDYARWATDISDVTVYTGVSDGDYTSQDLSGFHADSMSIHRFRARRIGLNTRIEIIPFSLIWRLYRQVRSAQRPIILHVWEFRGIIPIVASLLAKLFPDRVQLVHSAFGQLHFKQSKIRRLYDRLFLRLFLSSLDLALVQNQHEAEEYSHLLNTHGAHCKVQLLPLHVRHPQSSKQDIPTIEIHQKIKQELRSRYGFPANARILLFLGRFNVTKGISRLLDLLPLLLAASPQTPAILLLAGADDGYLSELRDKVSVHPCRANIHIITDVTNARFDYYALADLFVAFPIMYEETMLASLEALASGTPILVSQEADVPYVEASGAGRVINYAAESAVKAALSLLADPSAGGQRARATALHHFGEEHIKRQFVRLLFPEASLAPSQGTQEFTESASVGP